MASGVVAAALAVAAAAPPRTARAAEPAGAASEPAGVPVPEAPAPAPAAVPAAASPRGPEPPPAALRIVGFHLEGTLMDPEPDLEALLRAVFPDGSSFVSSGPADRIGLPIGTLPRARRALDQIGYDATVEAQPAPGGVVLRVRLRPYDRLRYIFVSGNGFQRQDEIQRRVSIRPGGALPFPGAERDAVVARERDRIVQFFHAEGFFDAAVRIDLESSGSAPAAIDFHIHVTRGDGYPVGPVVVTGNKAISTPDIEKTFRHLDPYTLGLRAAPFKLRQLRTDVAHVVDRYRDESYFGVRIGSSFDPERSIDHKNKNVAVGVQASEHKRISLVFEGNQARSASALKGLVTFKERGSYDDYEADASAEQIQHDYQQHGFFFARVDWRRERLAEDQDRVIFVIDEGPELKVRGVEFAGNRAFSGGELADAVTVKTFPLLGYIGLGSGGYVTARQVELDAQRVEGFYRSLGYPDVAVRGEVATSPENFGLMGVNAALAETVSRRQDRIYVRFTVDEGHLVRVASETFRAAAVVPDAGTTDDPIPYPEPFLRASLSLRPGEPYRSGLLREDGRRLERLMGDAGYPVATAESDVERTGDLVSVRWTVKSGPRVRVGPIFVRGNFLTTRATVLEQIPLGSGDYLTTTAFERGQRNLSFLQLFNNASPIRFPGKDEAQAVVPMVVEVEERSDQYNVLHLGVGVSSEQAPLDSSSPVGGYLRVGYDHRNLFGHGWNLSANATYGSAWTLGNDLVRASATLLDRRFFGTLFRFDISSQYYQQATVRLGDIRSWGISFGFAREMYPGVDASIHYNIRDTTHTEDLIRLSGANEDQTSITLDTGVSSLSAGLQWLRLDNRLLPTRGFRFEALAELASPRFSLGYASSSFLKVGLHSTVVVPLASWLSLRHGFRYDQGFPTGSDSLLPKVERYFAGGDTTIRGFQLDRARIEENRIAYVGDVYLVQYRPIGGNLRLLQNLDLQFPILPPWYGSVFWDNGIVADSFDGMRAASWRHGIGVTPLLIRLPIGDLSFAWGWPLDPGPGDTKIGVLHVNIGLLF